MNRPGPSIGSTARRLLASAMMALCLLSPLSVFADPSDSVETKAAADAGTSPVQLDPAEQAFIQRHPVIRVGIDNDWLPFEYLDEHGRHRGIAADYLALLSQLVGLEFRPVILPTWQDTLEAMQRGEIDILSMAAETPQRSVYASFTTPYVRSPMVAVTQRDRPFMATLAELPEGRVAVVPGYASHEHLRRQYPDLELVEVDTTLAGLQLVAAGEVPAMVDNLAAVTDLMIRFGLANLKVSGQLGQSFDLSIAVRRDLPELLSILEKGLAAIPEGQRVSIYNRWVEFEVDTRPNYRRVAQIGAVVVLVLLIMGIYNRRLSRYRTELEQANRQLAILSETDALTGVANRLALEKQLGQQVAMNRRHRLPVSIALLDLDQFKSVNDAFGHPKGDEVLRTFTRLVAGQIRQIDMFGRWGGEEFLLICPTTDLAECRRVAERILAAIRAHDFGIGRTQTFSAGIATLHEEETSEQLLARCDQLLYRAKQNGRNQIIGPDQASTALSM